MNELFSRIQKLVEGRGNRKITSCVGCIKRRRRRRDNPHRLLKTFVFLLWSLPVVDLIPRFAYKYKEASY